MKVNSPNRLELQERSTHTQRPEPLSPTAKEQKVEDVLGWERAGRRLLQAEQRAGKELGGGEGGGDDDIGRQASDPGLVGGATALSLL